MREASLDPPAPEVPDFIKGVKLDDLHELCENEGALSGLWEKSEAATVLHERLLGQASQNEEHSKHLEKRSSELGELRKEVASLITEERAAHEKWLKAESKMYEATQQYSHAGIQRDIENQISTLDEESRRLEGQLVDGAEFDGGPIAFAKQYVTLRRQYYYNKTLLNSVR